MNESNAFRYKNIIAKIEGLNPINACIRCCSFNSTTSICTIHQKESQTYNCCDSFIQQLNFIKIVHVDFKMKQRLS